MAAFNSFQGDFDLFGLAVVYDSQKRIVPISRFWNQNPAILVFLRHFGCVSCRCHSKDVWSKRQSLEKNGARIVFIGNGATENIEDFRENYGLSDAPVFTDPSLKAFQHGGFHHGLSYLLKPSSAEYIITESLQGNQNGNPFARGTGSNRQMGGIVVVHPGNRVSYHYISDAIGDTPQAEDIPSSLGA